MDNGGAAFPGLYGAKLAEVSELGENAVKVLDAQTGMTLRDYFAARLIVATMTHGMPASLSIEESMTVAARAAYNMADAMLVERAR